MMFFLDTNTCIYFLKGMYRSILDEFKKRKPEEIKISSMVKAELLLGVEKSERKEENLEIYNKFLEPFEIVGFGDRAAVLYAKIRASLEKKGRVVGPNDMIIAATVMAEKGILVSHNVKEYKQISGLLLEDWVYENSK
ncbi:MAG: type II toxin-antitoxin system VapC family toxin [Candidatus Riflebacteria bacterium]|nr:type II toxin-antitoxin system VapC family toxin [Candidatus Riflebacteria bacterium]